MSTDPRQGRQAPPWQTILSGTGFGVRGQVPPDQLRVSDAERQQVADQLGRHYAEGRLDQAEHDERLSRAMGARTRGDFRGLLDDLPPAGPTGAPMGAPPPMAPVSRSWMHRLLLIACVIFIASAVGAALSAPWHVPWVLLLILGFLLLRGPLRYRRHHHHHWGPHSHPGPGPGPWGGGTY